MYPSWIDPVMRVCLTRERAAPLRNDWMVANGSALERAGQVDAGRGDADGKMLARLTRLVAALAARRRLAPTIPVDRAPKRRDAPADWRARPE